MEANQIAHELLSLSDVRFPTLPTAMTKINDLMRDPDASIQDVVGALTNPTLVVRVLQVANSPALRVSRKVSTVAEAVAVLGLDLIRNIVLCVTMRDTFSCRDLVLARYLDEVWRHSLEVASITAVLARRFRMNMGPALSAGLLHDIGALPIVDYYERHSIPTDSLKNTMDRSRQELGAGLLRMWEFPDEIIKATYRGDLDELISKPKPVDLVTAAHYISDNDEKRLTRLGLTVDDFTEMLHSDERETILKDLQ